MSTVSEAPSVQLAQLPCESSARSHSAFSVAHNSIASVTLSAPFPTPEYRPSPAAP